MSIAPGDMLASSRREPDFLRYQPHRSVKLRLATKRNQRSIPTNAAYAWRRNVPSPACRSCIRRQRRKKTNSVAAAQGDFPAPLAGDAIAVENHREEDVVFPPCCVPNWRSPPIVAGKNVTAPGRNRFLIAACGTWSCSGSTVMMPRACQATQEASRRPRGAATRVWRS